MVGVPVAAWCDARRRGRRQQAMAQAKEMKMKKAILGSLMAASFAVVALAGKPAPASAHEATRITVPHDLMLGCFADCESDADCRYNLSCKVCSGTYCWGQTQ